MAAPIAPAPVPLGPVTLRHRPSRALFVRRAVFLVRAATTAMMLTALMWTATFDALVDEQVKVRPRPQYVAPSWTPDWAAVFPGCGPVDSIEAPTTVIEVRVGVPARVNFDDAWRRTHDADPLNHGDVVGACE